MLRPFIVLLSALLLAGPHNSYAQCAAAPVAAAACSGGNGAATNGTNINSGNTYWFSGGPTTFPSGVNLNSGGIFRVCGNLTLSSMSFNGGDLIIENGGKLTINTSLTLSGAVIINRGTLIINGSLTLQGSNNYVYNDLSTSVFTMTNGGADLLTINGTSSFLINRGIMTIDKLLIQGTTGAVCMQDDAILNLTELDNNFTNSISYSGSGAPACVNVSTTAVLNNDVASSSKIHVCTNATPSGGAGGDATHGWGSASVTTGCTSCASVLALANIALSATMRPGQVSLQWTTGSDPLVNDMFFIERSVDGKNFTTIGSQEMVAGEAAYSATDAKITNLQQYYRIRWLNTATGVSRYSPIVEVETGINEGFKVFPNPVGPAQAINIVLFSSAAGNAELFLLDPAGQVVGRRTVMLAVGNNTIAFGPFGELAAGVYFIRVINPSGGSLFSRIILTVQPR